MIFIMNNSIIIHLIMDVNC